jgi:hypothetical protein
LFTWSHDLHNEKKLLAPKTTVSGLIGGERRFDKGTRASEGSLEAELDQTISCGAEARVRHAEILHRFSAQQRFVVMSPMEIEEAATMLSHE